MTKMKFTSFKKILLFLVSILIISCSQENEDPKKPVVKTARRTVIVYITGEAKNISSGLSEDVYEMCQGSYDFPADCNLIAFIDLYNAKPQIAQIRNGKKEVVRQYDHDFHSVNPDSMLSIYNWIIKKYPAQEYATVLEGHGSGTVVSNHETPSSFQTLKAYGYDNNGEDPNDPIAYWMNIPTMAKVFSKLPHMAYIFFDCCSMQTLEVAYELRNCTDYIIAPVSEVPGSGAPYKTITPVLAHPKDSVGKEIVKHYIEDSNFLIDGVQYDGICISAIKTSELTPLLHAVKSALYQLDKGSKHKNNRLQLDRVYSVYYYNNNSLLNVHPILFDIKSILHNNGLADDQLVDIKNCLDNAIVAKYPVNPEKFKWFTSIGINSSPYNFVVNDANYSGISMMIPNEQYAENIPNQNQGMFIYEAANVIDWHGLGW